MNGCQIPKESSTAIEIRRDNPVTPGRNEARLAIDTGTGHSPFELTELIKLGDDPGAAIETSDAPFSIQTNRGQALREATDIFVLRMISVQKRGRREQQAGMSVARLSPHLEVVFRRGGQCGV